MVLRNKRKYYVFEYGIGTPTHCYAPKKYEGLTMSSSMISSLNLLVVLLGAIFAYYKFFREGAHHQRIEFDLECVDLGIHGDFRIIEVGIIADNKGNIEQKFDQILLKIRGIKEKEELQEIKNHEPRLSFPEKIPEVSVISKKYNYFFVRPGVSQRFPVVVKIPINWSQLHTRSTFRYYRASDIHSAERAFKLASNA
jgi:hypothetical protein